MVGDRLWLRGTLDLRQLQAQGVLGAIGALLGDEEEVELRGTLDAYYLTWCPDCERLWRFELWTLVHSEEPERKMPWLTWR